MLPAVVIARPRWNNLFMTELCRRIEVPMLKTLLTLRWDLFPVPGKLRNVSSATPTPQIRAKKLVHTAERLELCQAMCAADSRFTPELHQTLALKSKHEWQTPFFSRVSVLWGVVNIEIGMIDAAG